MCQIQVHEQCLQYICVAYICCKMFLNFHLYFPLLPLLYIHKCVYEPLHCVISVSHGRKINEFDYFQRSTVSNIQNRKSSCIFAHPIFFFLFFYFSQSFPLLIFALKTTIRCIVIISSSNNKNNKGGGT